MDLGQQLFMIGWWQQSQCHCVYYSSLIGPSGCWDDWTGDSKLACIFARPQTARVSAVGLACHVAPQVALRAIRASGCNPLTRKPSQSSGYHWMFLVAILPTSWSSSSLVSTRGNLPKKIWQHTVTKSAFLEFKTFKTFYLPLESCGGELLTSFVSR